MSLQPHGGHCWIESQQELIYLGEGVVVSSLSCVMCQAVNESSQHHFVEYDVSQRVWVHCFKWIGILYVQHMDLKCHFEHF